MEGGGRRSYTNAAAPLTGLGLDFGFITPETFPLPSLHGRLRAVSEDIHNVRGFAVLRGIPVDRYDRRENVAIFAGLSSHVGRQRARQDHNFDGKPAAVVISHITDLRSAQSGKAVIGSPAYTNDAQAFHNDSGDVIALYMIEECAKGGESLLASSWRVYNELARERPDLIRTLAGDWPVDR